MSSLSDTKLIEQMPPSLSGDPQVQALCITLDAHLQAMPAILHGAVILPQIATLPERVLDLLAWQFHAENYRQDYPLATKRALVQQSLLIHRRRGTPAAVQEVVNIIFGPGLTVQEWFQYGGDPYYFRIIGGEGFDSPEQQAALVAAISLVKNARSHFEVITTGAEPAELYVGCAVHVAVRQRIA